MRIEAQVGLISFALIIYLTEHPTRVDTFHRSKRVLDSRGVIFNNEEKGRLWQQWN